MIWCVVAHINSIPAPHMDHIEPLIISSFGPYMSHINCFGKGILQYLLRQEEHTQNLKESVHDNRIQFALQFAFESGLKFTIIIMNVT